MYKFRKVPIDKEFNFCMAFKRILGKSLGVYVICYRTWASANTTHCIAWNCDKKYILDCTSHNVEPFHDSLDDIHTIAIALCLNRYE